MNVEQLIFGSNTLEGIVACEPKDNTIELFFEREDGSVESVVKPHRYWLLSSQKIQGFERLKGDQHYCWRRFFNEETEWRKARNWFYRKEIDSYSAYDAKEQAMLDRGFTYFKGLKVSDVSALAFDIETNGLLINDDSHVFLIANTFQHKGQTIRRMFSIDEYKSPAALIDAWCAWVRDINPSVILGHNIFTFDLPFLAFVASKNNTSLALGRDGSNIVFNEKESKFRKDGSQFYHYHKAHIYGRNLIDTMFLAVKYDIGRKYDNYRLKSIIEQEGLQAKDRQFYDAGLIAKNWCSAIEREKIKKYAEFDGDDAMALYNLMIPSFFYLSQMVPKSFEEVLLSAPGSQINSMLVRSYLQDGYSIPKADTPRPFEGAISLGNPGIYQHAVKWDVASLYPSIILQNKLYSQKKDPKAYFLKMADYLTHERLKNKALAQETGERHYKDLEQAMKTVINSFYGFCGAEGLNFNSPTIAAVITEIGRDILQKSIYWAEAKGFKLVNADTDSITITNNQPISQDIQTNLLAELNDTMPEKIRFMPDGYFESMVVVKAKNYAMFDGKKIKIKGSALKATMKELALKEFLDKSIQLLLKNDKDAIKSLYETYVYEIMNLTNISRWASKKTITDKVLNPKRTNEQKVFDAIQSSDYREADKIRVYYTINDELKLEEHWNNDHDIYRLLKKLYDTVSIFETILNIDDDFTNYSLKRQRTHLEKFKEKRQSA